ncbi:DUF4350 domain-containing protein [Thermococcus celer]|uniref:DUF4350 domain-containing protein n=1 Tax=Thermococcus celer Vu 13 = JCM 8558 TaxID=1293037 RepID=A0A218P0E7_THECE|nr:DUF4350 domain-containing protein [Thermococcus celer]ASI98395.1 hypothetical protein A3L02_01860 [Thermococcus celer Vu 13 = JCM 8558]
MNKTIRYLILILLILTFLTMPLTVPMFKSSTAYSMFNTGWDGVSGFARLAYHRGKTITPIFQSFDIAGVGDLDGVLLIIGPNVTFTAAEMEGIKLFLERGNTLFIADDFGTGNEILRALNVPVGISKDPLRDFFYDKDDRFVVSVRIEDPILARNVTEIITNEPSAIIVTGNGEAYASKVSMVNFHRRMFPLLTEVRYGKGRIVVLSDPDVLTNQLYGENEPFLRNLIDYLGGDRFYIDEAHHPDFNLYTTGTVTITRVLSRRTAIGLMLLIATMILLWEIGAFGITARLTSRLLARLFNENENVEEVALLLAEERGWDEKEIIEMLERMGG